MVGDWIELRCEGKMHGQLNSDLLFVTVRGDWAYIYDLAATIRERRPIVTRIKAEDYSTYGPLVNGDQGKIPA